MLVVGWTANGRRSESRRSAQARRSTSKSENASNTIAIPSNNISFFFNQFDKLTDEQKGKNATVVFRDAKGRVVQRTDDDDEAEAEAKEKEKRCNSEGAIARRGRQAARRSIMLSMLILFFFIALLA